jgi:hypothetical protein
MVKLLLVFILVAILMDDSASIRKTEEERKEEEEIAKAVNATLEAEEAKRKKEEEDEKKKQLELEKKKDKTEKKKNETRDKKEEEKGQDEACPTSNQTCPDVGECPPCGPCPKERECSPCEECPEEKPCHPCRPCGPCPTLNRTSHSEVDGCPESGGSGMTVPVALLVGASAGVLVTGVATIIGLLLRYTSPIFSGLLFVTLVVLTWYLSSHYPETARELGGRAANLLREAAVALGHRLMAAVQRHQEQVSVPITSILPTF